MMLGLRRRRKEHPTTLFLCMHKGASTFIADLLGPRLASCRKLDHWQIDARLIAGASIRAFSLPLTGVLVTRLYPHHLPDLVEDPAPERAPFSEKKLIVLRRDPRDALVSLYYAIAFSHDPTQVQNPTGWQRLREQLRTLPKTEGMQLLVDRAPWLEFEACSRWIACWPQALVTHYETLVTDFPRWAAEVSDYLALSIDERQHVFAGLDQEVAPPSRVDPGRHKRRVLPGAWREEFDAALTERVRERFGDQLQHAGYAW